MAVKKVKRSVLARNLRNKFRLVVMNDKTLEEKYSMRLTPLNVIVFGGTFVLSLITVTLYIIAFTGLREYIPGYADVNMRRNMVKMTVRTDSLQYLVNAHDAYLKNLVGVIQGTQSDERPKRDTLTSTLYDSIRKLEHSDEDSMLRLQMESRDRFDLLESGEKAFASGIGSYSFFAPLKGTIVTQFNPAQKHYGIDIVAGPDEVIKSALDGTVVLSNFTSETGYVIGVQHSNNLFTLYKHNSALLKKTGDFVRAGEVIAIIGNTGELTSGPHLHFELWFNGNPVDPKDYIAF